MGEDSMREEIVQLFRSLGSKVSHFISLLFDPTHAGSIGALAFAIALFCTWKLLKSPGNQRNKIPEKPDAVPQNATGSTKAGPSSSVAVHHTQATQRGVVIREPEIPVQLSLAQIVRRQLNGGRKMTCQLLGVILEETSPEDLQRHAVVRPAVVDVLLELAQACDLYLMTRLLDDESEANVVAALEAVGLFSVGGLNRNKVLFCSTEAGRTSFVRQLEPDWHVDTSMETISQLARFIRYELHVSQKGVTPASASNVLGSESLENHFGQLGHDS